MYIDILGTSVKAVRTPEQLVQQAHEVSHPPTQKAPSDNSPHIPISTAGDKPKPASKGKDFCSKRKDFHGDADHKPTVRVARDPVMPQVPEAHCPPMLQVPPTSSPHIPFGSTEDTFSIGTFLSKRKKRKLSDRNAQARATNCNMNSTPDSEWIRLLRQIFVEESDHELNTIHTNYLQANSSKAPADLIHDVELQAEDKTGLAHEMALTQRRRDRQARIDHAQQAVRADDLDIPAHKANNCRRRKDRELSEF